MKFMLLMNHQGTGPYEIDGWPPEAIKAHIAFMGEISRKLGASGEMVGGEGLAGPEQARLVKAGKDGRPVTDGVFPESKEFLAGYWIVDVDGAERAYQIAAEISLAPGPTGAPLHLAVEVRPVMSGPPADWVA